MAKKTVANPRKRKASKDQPVSFLALCERHGYDPGEELIRRQRELQSVLYRLEAGENVPEWTGMGHRSSWNTINPSGEREGVVSQLIGRIRREIREIDVELLPYRYAKLRSVEVSGGEQPLEMVIRWDSDDDSTS